MNVLIPMPDGSLHALTDHDARVLDGFLADRECHGLEVDQLAIRRLRNELKLALDAESHFDAAKFTPPWYAPGWQADP